MLQVTGRDNGVPHGNGGRRHHGKVAFVTGASAGIGEGIALRLAAEGAAIALVALDRPGVDRVRKKIESRGGRAIALGGDVRDGRAVKRMADEAFVRLGRVDYLVNNAGVYSTTPLFDLKEAEWDRVVDTNLKGPFLCAQAIAARMIDDGIEGRIVNISSTSSLLARPGAAHYAASKAGVNMLTRVLAIELGQHGILVNAVCPGVIISPGLLRTIRVKGGRTEHQSKLARIPLGREGRLDEIAALVSFLLSDDSSYCTGGVFVSDGGYTCGIAAYDGVTRPRGRPRRARTAATRGA